MNKKAKTLLSQTWYDDSTGWLSPEERETKSIFGAYAADYDRHRPSYPDELWNHVLTSTELPSGATVADIGTGTGRGAFALAERGYSVKAVDPDELMVAQVTQNAKHAGMDARMHASVGSAENTGLADNSASLAICLQAFHWFNQSTALAEFSRVLESDAPLAVIWYDRDLSAPWVNAMEEVIERYNPAYNRAMRQCDGWFQDDITPFVLSSYTAMPSNHPFSNGIDDVVDLVFTFSYVNNAIDASKHDEFREDLREALQPHAPIDALPLVYRIYILQNTTKSS